MKAYQVFKGEQDKHGHQRYDLVATYLDKEKALAHCKQIAESTPLYGDVLEEGEFYGDGKYKSWVAIGWDRVTIAQFEEIIIFDDEQPKQVTLYDWSEVPENVEWICTSRNGHVEFWKGQPTIEDDAWGSPEQVEKYFDCHSGQTRFDLADDWKNSLEKRPS